MHTDRQLLLLINFFCWHCTQEITWLCTTPWEITFYISNILWKSLLLSLLIRLTCMHFMPCFFFAKTFSCICGFVCLCCICQAVAFMYNIHIYTLYIVFVKWCSCTFLCLPSSLHSVVFLCYICQALAFVSARCCICCCISVYQEEAASCKKVFKTNFSYLISYKGKEKNKTPVKE